MDKDLGMTTNLVDIHAVEVTLTTQKNGDISIPTKVKGFLDVHDEDWLSITRRDKQMSFQLASGEEARTWKFLPGGATARIRIAKD